MSTLEQYSKYITEFNAIDFKSINNNTSKFEEIYDINAKLYKLFISLIDSESKYILKEIKTEFQKHTMYKTISHTVQTTELNYTHLLQIINEIKIIVNKLRSNINYPYKTNLLQHVKQIILYIIYIDKYYNYDAYNHDKDEEYYRSILRRKYLESVYIFYQSLYYMLNIRYIKLLQS